MDGSSHRGPGELFLEGLTVPLWSTVGCHGLASLTLAGLFHLSSAGPTGRLHPNRLAQTYSHSMRNGTRAEYRNTGSVTVLLPLPGFRGQNKSQDQAQPQAWGTQAPACGGRSCEVTLQDRL